MTVDSSERGPEGRSDCPLCGARGVGLWTHRTSVTSESRVLSTPSTLSACGGCGHLFTAMPIDWEAYYRDHYDATLSDDGMDEIVTAKDGSASFRTDVDYGFMRAMVGERLTPRSRVLEFGAGRGRILSRLRKDGFEDLTAVELGEKYAAPLAALVGSDRVFIGERPAGAFDFVCSFFALEHDVDPLGSLRWLRSVTAPGGTLFLMLPYFETNAVDLACADHLHHYRAEVLEAMLGAAGFDVDEIDTTASLGAILVTATQRGGVPRALAPREGAYERSLAAVKSYMDLAERIESLGDRLEPETPVCLYGAGFYATLAAASLGGLPISAVFDKNPKKHGLVRLGATVLDPRAIEAGGFEDRQLVVCVNGLVAGAIRDAYAPKFRRAMTL